MWVWARFIFWSTLSIRTESSEMLQLSPKSCIKIKGVPTVAKATCELELTLSSRKSFEKRNKLTYSSDHLLLFWTAGVVKNVSKGANESFSLLILSSVDIRFEKTVALMPEKKWLTNSPALDPQPYWIEFPTLMDRLLAFKTWKKITKDLDFSPG